MQIIPNYDGGDVRANNAIGGALNPHQEDYEWNLALAARRQVMAAEEAEALEAEETAAKLEELKEHFANTLQPYKDAIEANASHDVEEDTAIVLLAEFGNSLSVKVNALQEAMQAIIASHNKLSEVVAAQAAVTTELAKSLVTFQDKLPGDTP